MAAPIQLVYNATGVTLYALIRNSSGQVWNGTAFVTFVAGDIGSYDVPITSAGGDLWTATFPTGAGTGTFTIQFYEQAGGAPATTDTLLRSATYRNDGSSSTGSSGPYLTTLANVKTFMGISDSTYHDARINQLLGLVTDQIQEYCERDFFSTTYDERYDGNAIGLNRGYLSLDNTPVTQLTSIVFDPDDSEMTETYNGDQFVFDTDTGFVRFDPNATYMRQWSKGFRNIRVQYVAGYANIPEALDTAAAMVVANMFRQSDKDPTLSRERIDQYEWQRASGTSYHDPTAVFGAATTIINRYRRVHFSA